MNYNISKLVDSNLNLATELKNKCYKVVGLCQQVHKEMGPFLNEYMYQEALDILFEENDILRVKEYYFSVMFHDKQIKHKHYVDFLVGNDILIECKAIDVPVFLRLEKPMFLLFDVCITKLCYNGYGLVVRACS